MSQRFIANIAGTTVIAADAIVSISASLIVDQWALFVTTEDGNSHCFAAGLHSQADAVAEMSALVRTLERMS